MRKIAFLLAICLTCFAPVFAQTTEASQPEQKPPYVSDKELPAFKIMETDSVTFFNTASIPKGKKSVLLFFDPTCIHCVHFLEKLFPAMDNYKKVNFYMMTVNRDLKVLKKFCTDYKTDKYKNIKVVGQDKDFFYIGHYGIKKFPSIAIYDEKKKFMGLYESDDVNLDNMNKHLP